MSDHHEESRDRSSGCLGTIAKGFLFLTTTGFAVACAFALWPQDIAAIEGSDPALSVAPQKNFKAVLRGSLDRGHEVSFTEEELNGYLARTFEGKHTGALGGKATVEGPWIRLEEGYAEIILGYRVAGHRLTVSTFVQIEQTEQPAGPTKTDIVLHGGPYLTDTYPNRGGRFGRLVVPQGFLLLVKPAFESLAQVCEEEVALISDIARIRIEENRVVFSPHPPDHLLPGAGASF